MFKWEKILHQDTIYPQLMSLRRKLWSNAIAESGSESDPYISQNILEQPSDENTAAICREQKVVCARLKLKFVFP